METGFIRTVGAVIRPEHSVAMIWCRYLVFSVGALLLGCEAHAFEEQDYCYRIDMKSMNEPDDTPFQLMVYLSPIPWGFHGSGKWQLINSKRTDGFPSYPSVWYYNKKRLVLQWPLGVDYGFEISLGPTAGDMSGSGRYYFGLRQSRQRRSVRAGRTPCAQTYTPHIPPKCFLWSSRRTSICHELQQIETFYIARSVARRGAKGAPSVEVLR